MYDHSRALLTIASFGPLRKTTVPLAVTVALHFVVAVVNELTWDEEVPLCRRQPPAWLCAPARGLWTEPETVVHEDGAGVLVEAEKGVYFLVREYGDGI